MTGRVSWWRTETQEADGLGDVTPSLGICHHSCYTDQLLCPFWIFSFINLLITVRQSNRFICILLCVQRSKNSFDILILSLLYEYLCKHVLVSCLTLITLTPALHANPDLAFGPSIVRVRAFILTLKDLQSFII